MYNIQATKPGYFRPATDSLVKEIGSVHPSITLFRRFAIMEFLSSHVAITMSTLIYPLPRRLCIATQQTLLYAKKNTVSTGFGCQLNVPSQNSSIALSTPRINCVWNITGEDQHHHRLRSKPKLIYENKV